MVKRGSFSSGTASEAQGWQLTSIQHQTYECVGYTSATMCLCEMYTPNLIPLTYIGHIAFFNCNGTLTWSTWLTTAFFLTVIFYPKRKYGHHRMRSYKGSYSKTVRLTYVWITWTRFLFLFMFYQKRAKCQFSLRLDKHGSACNLPFNLWNIFSEEISSLKKQVRALSSKQKTLLCELYYNQSCKFTHVHSWDHLFKPGTRLCCG